MIAAIGENRSLGKDNKLLWHLPDDFKRFKQITTGYKIIMGRKTFESFPKPLPNRFHIIISRNLGYSTDHPQCTVVHSLEEALQMVEADKKSFIIGGGQIYADAMERTNRIYLTRVHLEVDGDTFLPALDDKEWKEVERRSFAKGDRDDAAFTLIVLDRVN